MDKEIRFFVTGDVVHLTPQAAKEASLDQGAWRVVGVVQEDLDRFSEDEPTYTCEKVEGMLIGRRGLWLHSELELVTNEPGCPCTTPSQS